MHADFGGGVADGQEFGHVGHSNMCNPLCQGIVEQQTILMPFLHSHAQPCTIMGMTAELTPLRWRPSLTLADRIRLMRVAYGRRMGRTVTQKELAALIGVSPGTWGGYESGNSRPDQADKFARKAAEVTGVDPVWLLGFDDPPGPGLDSLPTGRGDGLATARILALRPAYPASVAA